MCCLLSSWTVITDSLTCNRRQFRDTTFEPTSDNTDQSMTLKGSGRRSPPFKTAPEGANRVDQADQLPVPSNAQEPPYDDLVLVANDTEFAATRQWLATTQMKWEYVSMTGYEVAKKTYRKSKSTIAMLELRGREDPLASFKGIVIRTLGVLAALVLLLSVMMVPFKKVDTDSNDVSMPSGKDVSLDTIHAFLPVEERITPMSSTECADMGWGKVNFLSAVPGRQSDGGSAKEVQPEDSVLSGDIVDSRRSINCTVLQRLYHHKRTYPWFRYVEDPLAGTEVPIAKNPWEGIKELHKKICEELRNVPSDVVTYFFEVGANMSDLYKHARYIQDVTREGTKQAPRGQSADATEESQISMAQIIPVWQMRLASLNTLATPLLQTLSDLQIDSIALKYRLIAARRGAALSRSESVESPSWPAWAAGWTKISKLQEKPVSAHTKTIARIDRWISETSALYYLVSNVYRELEYLDMTIREVLKKRLTSDGPYPWSSTDSSEEFDSVKTDLIERGVISADSLELELFLTGISQEFRRIRKFARSSKSMQGWGEAKGSKESGDPSAGKDGELERRPVASV